MTGAKEAKSKLDNILKQLRIRTQSGVEKIGDSVMEEAKELTPVRIEHLLESRYLVNESKNLLNTGNFVPSKYRKLSEVKAVYIHTTLTAMSQARKLKARYGAACGIGYAASYAEFVHEYPLSGYPGYRGHNQGDPPEFIHSRVGRWKFFIDPLNKVKANGLSILKTETEKTVK